MADIRIKDLATLESASLTGDVFVIDGTTGTRKLSAFSPSFGGNATVTGTLTVSGTGASSFGGRLAIGATALSDRMFYVSGNTGTTGASQFSAVVNPTIPNTVTTGAYGLYLGTNIATGATVTNGYSLFIAAPDYTGSTVTNKYGLYSNDPNPSYFVGRVLIDNSTASTTTSTGALVVSGGVGIAKALFAGESAYFAGAVGATDAVLKNGFGRSANGYAYFDLVGDTTYTDYGMRLLRGNSGANAISQIAHRGTGTLEVVTVDAAPIAFFTNGSNLALTITSGQQVQCNATTASTSTSSGALVVSGGVGVAKEVYAAQFKTDSGTTGAVASGSATTILSLSGKTAQMYLVHASILGVNDAANYAAFATVVMDGTSARIVSNNATLMTITLSGTNVQATQTSGVNQTLVWKYTSL